MAKYKISTNYLSLNDLFTQEELDTMFYNNSSSEIAGIITKASKPELYKYLKEIIRSKGNIIRCELKLTDPNTDGYLYIHFNLNRQDFQTREWVTLSSFVTIGWGEEILSKKLNITFVPNNDDTQINIVGGLLI